MNYKLLNNNSQKTFAVILDSGDETIESLQRFAREQQVTAAGFTALGAFSQANVGFYDFAIKDYQKINFEEQMEVLSITGDISIYEGKVQLHAHAVLG